MLRFESYINKIKILFCFFACFFTRMIYLSYGGHKRVQETPINRQINFLVEIILSYFFTIFKNKLSSFYFILKRDKFSTGSFYKNQLLNVMEEGKKLKFQAYYLIQIKFFSQSQKAAELLVSIAWRNVRDPQGQGVAGPKAQSAVCIK